MISKNTVLDNKVVYVLMLLSILFFIFKGITYATIGSYYPILFVFVAIILLAWSYLSTQKTHHRVLRLWAVIIILWALARLSLWVILQIDQGLTETHLREQFGVLQHTLSILMMCIGIGIFKLTRKKCVTAPNHQINRD